MEENEIWKEVSLSENEKFTVSNKGRIVVNGKEACLYKIFRKSGKGKGTKIPVSFYAKFGKEKGKYYNASRLIAMAFVDGFDYNCQVGYKDKDCFNLNASNLFNTKDCHVEDLPGEVWKPFPYAGYDDYKVSNLGRVKRSNAVTIKGRYFGVSLLSQAERHGGYLSVAVHDKNHKGKMFLVHRVVADAFIENKDNLPQVNHKDEDKHNNAASNLEWCDLEYNLTYGTRIQRYAYSKSHHIKAVSESGEVRVFNSLKDANKATGVSPITINKHIKDGQYWKGYKWYRI